MTSTPSTESPRKSRLKSDGETHREKPKSSPSSDRDRGKISEIIKRNKGKILLVVAGVLAVGTATYCGYSVYTDHQNRQEEKAKRETEQAKEKTERDQTPNPSIKVQVDYRFEDGKINIEDVTPKATIDECKKEHQLIDTGFGETQIEGGGEFSVPVTLVFDGHKKGEKINYTATIWAYRNDPKTTAEIDFSLNNQPPQ